MRTLFMVSFLFILAGCMIGCSSISAPVGNAKQMLGKTEMDIKQFYGIPAKQYVDNGYTVLVFSDRIYHNLFQYGAIDKYQHTMFWIKDGRCTNWLVKEDQNPPDQVNYRIY